MSKSSKAVLLSALVFPGAGHLHLKRYITGAVLVCAALAALYLIAADILERALAIMEKIERGEVSPDVAAIAELLSRQPIGDESLLLDAALPVLVICWVIGIADSYRCGRALDKHGINESDSLK
jgi:uncharacterized membrane protein